MMDEIEVEMEGGGGDLTDLTDALRFDLIAVEGETDMLQEESVEFAEELQFLPLSREGGIQYGNSPPKKKGGIAVNVCPSQSIDMRKWVLEIQNDLSSRRPEEAAGATPKRIFKVYRETFESYINRRLLLQPTSITLIQKFLQKEAWRGAAAQAIPEVGKRGMHFVGHEPDQMTSAYKNGREG
uniref:Uncharacterized protein n=1 Tax=Chromera velia CCMP2878 TaxID=1169474 RepID=A0A0G4HL18_9ALVE|eukprot:Cvel_28589.t1-p1 / transcript=Cvel_28589.t1 / gene=Cvel_28589 / organism=Chromera_velia_CCMP2878 / gene_product=hypothetical protein / transcript_product=hypothetical protein / location=Cvel_scaffold3770:4617-5162(+) / protein_length=182 / sequence_SO=supercontig / SO=protein_coding / is_pseudo=false